MEKESDNQILDELKKLMTRLPEEQQRRAFYVLDYVLNYYRGERRLPKLLEMGFHNELTELKGIGVVVETSEYWRGQTYSRLHIKDELKEEIVNLLREKYHPAFEDKVVTEKLRKIVGKSLSAATKLWHKVEEFKRMEPKIIEHTLSGYGEYQRDIIELGEDLAKCELGFFIGYWSTSWTTYSDEFIFRSEPIDAQALFLKIVEEEANRTFTSFTPAMRWCAYLKFLEPDADERFLLNNRTTRFFPAEIKEAFNKLPDLRIEKFREVAETVLAKERERLLDVIKNLLNRDSSIAQAIGTLLLLAEEKERYLNINNWSLGKIKETSAHSYEKLCNYTKILSDFGVILTSNYGDLIIPKMLQEVFDEAIKGGALELKIFESELDAEAFIEEAMAKATSNIKIWDPYVSTRTLRIIEKSINPNSVGVEILSSQPIIIDEILTLIMKGIKIKAKMVYQKKGEKYLSPFHDRYLIVDHRYVWHFGPSLHAAGEKAWETASLFPEQFAKIILDAFLYNLYRNAEEWKQDGYQVIEKEFESRV
ncbi:hypothetical protein HXY32_00195 [Candidatus Bathyarchaeota archaeon]|nr:hypothetical protein [Candidatus Bathyarchaeota archaeon]